MLPEAALHFKEVTVHPPRCMPLSAHSLCSKKEPALSYACLSCSRVWVGAFSWLTVTGALLVPSRALSDASSGLLRSVFFWCLLGQFYLWPPVSHASLLVSELSLSERLGGCQRNTGSVLFFLVPDAGCCTPTASTLLQVGTLVAAQVNPCAALSGRAALPPGYHRARVSGHLQGMFQGACGICPTSAWEGRQFHSLFSSHTIYSHAPVYCFAVP
uniref:Uncharacterized protein n=1 Tax=Eutreptiella gymnastica TaxID=73025 RepID=A0A7S4GEL9_9EUGL